MCIYVSEIYVPKEFVSFPWWLENVKSRPKLALLLNKRHFETCFPQMKTITFLKQKLSKLHKKVTILDVTITFFLKQCQTRASSGPICHPLLYPLKC